MPMSAHKSEFGINLKISGQDKPEALPNEQQNDSLGIKDISLPEPSVHCD